MKKSILSILILFAAAMLACATNLVAQDQAAREYEAIRNIIVALHRHPDPDRAIALVKQQSATPQTHLMKLSVAGGEYSYIRATAVDLLSRFPEDLQVLEFLETRIADADYAERSYALHGYARGFHAKHAARVTAFLQQCREHSADKLLRAQAARLLTAASKGTLRNSPPGTAQRIKQGSQ